MLPDKYGIHEKTVKKADGSYRSLPMLRIHYYFYPHSEYFILREVLIKLIQNEGEQ